MTESAAEPPAGGDEPVAVAAEAELGPEAAEEDGLDLADGDAEAVEALRAALDCLHGDQFDDIIEALRAAARAEDLALSTPDGVAAAFAQVIAELQARGVRVDGRPISGPLDVLGWMARGIEAVEAGEPYFDLDPGRPDAARMFWAGDVIDPQTGEYVAADPSAPAGEDNRLSNKHFATVVSSKLWQEGVAATPVEETPDGRLINKLGLGRRAVGDYLSGLIDSMEATGTAAADMSLMWRIGGGGGGSGRSSKAAVKSFGNVVDQFLHTQYGLQASTAIYGARAAGAAVPAVGVVTQGAYAASTYAQHVAPALRGAEPVVVYMAQGRAADGTRLAPAAARPRPVTAAELAAAAPVAAAGGAAAGVAGAAGAAAAETAAAGTATVATATGGAAAATGTTAGVAGAEAGVAAGAAAGAAAAEEEEKQSILGKLWDRAKPGDKQTPSDVTSGREAAKLARAEGGGEPPEPLVSSQFRGNQAAKVDGPAEPPRTPAEPSTGPSAGPPVEPPPAVHVVQADQSPIDLRSTPPSTPAPPATPPVTPPATPVVPPAVSAPQARPAPPRTQPPAAAAPAVRQAPPGVQPADQPQQPLPPLPSRAEPPPQGDLAAPLPAAEAQRARDLLDRARRAREQARGRGGSGQPRERRASLPQEQPRPRQSPHRPSK
ncbi:hypothetical protein [Fodinicola acaciae]|uniref:hypothetical protein n=1 Tax=Fodinicola acaciae TaxID=2681555 RepID=UPI0013D31F95|nr:hypothetical protein [Fodinicola acaciae]